MRRRADRRDRRQVRVGLTDVGRRLIDTVTARRRDEIAALLAALSLEEQQAVAGALHRLAASAGEVPEQGWSSGWDL